MNGNSQQTTTLAVIAGGAGARMGGPKHALRIAGVPILLDLLRRAEWSGPTLLVLGTGAVEEVPGAEAFDSVVHDSMPGRGPLFGVLEALGHCETESILAIPVDMCDLAAEHLEWVRIRGAAQPGHGQMLRRRDASTTRIEPFPLFLRLSAAPTIRQMLAEGDAAVRALAHCPGFVVADAPPEWPPEVWSNANTPEDLAEVMRRRGYTELDSTGGA